MAHGDEPVRAHDLSALRILGSTGEPWNDVAWRWYFSVVGRGRCPVINISGGTEVGACFLSPHPVEALTSTTLGGPALGMAVDVFDDNGRPVRAGGGADRRRGDRARQGIQARGHRIRRIVAEDSKREGLAPRDPGDGLGRRPGRSVVARGPDVNRRDPRSIMTSLFGRRVLLRPLAL